MEFRVLIYSTLISLLFFGCTKEVKIDIPGFEEQLVIDGRIETNMPPIVLISKTQPIYSETSLNSILNGFQSGAIVTVSDGTTTVVLDEVCSDNLPPGTEAMAAALFGIPESELANYHVCAYTSFNTAIWGQVGKTYSLKVELNGKVYTSSTSILPPTALDSTYWKQEQTADPGFGYSWAQLSDNGNQYDAYFWEVKRINHINGVTKDANFKATFNPVFDDEFVNGQTFEFYYENPFTWDDETIPDKNKGLYQQGDSVVIKFSKVESAVYEFLEKKYIQLGTGGNPFASPTSIPSNIQGGAIGVWAGFSPSFDTLYCVP
jgi:hypothetical protein